MFPSYPMNIPQLVFDFVEFVEKFAIISGNDGNVLPSFDMKIRKFSLSGLDVSRNCFENFNANAQNSVQERNNIEAICFYVRCRDYVMTTLLSQALCYPTYSKRWSLRLASSNSSSSRAEKKSTYRPRIIGFTYTRFTKLR